MKHLFIINPAAGKKKSTHALVQKIEALGLDSEIVLTEKQGDALRFTEEAAGRREPVRIYACGGDGTLNEVVCGAAGHGHVAITNVPKGTGNDFLRIFGPNFRARFSDLEALSKGPQAAFDLIEINGKLGIGTSCAGVDARVAADVDRYKRLPLVSGIGAYILSLIVNVLFKGICRPAKVIMGDWTYEGPTAIICICNGRYYGGGFMPVGEAMPDDGVLDFLVVPKIGLMTFLRFVKKYSTGQYEQFPHLVHAYHGTQITFSSSEELTAVIDGEPLRAREFQVRMPEEKVNFFYPADVNYEPAPEFAGRIH